MASMIVDMRHVWIAAIAALILTSIDASIFKDPRAFDLLFKTSVFVCLIGTMYEFKKWSVGRYSSQHK